MCTSRRRQIRSLLQYITLRCRHEPRGDRTYATLGRAWVGIEPLEGRQLLSVAPAWVDQGPAPIINSPNAQPDPGDDDFFPYDVATGAVESIAVNPNQTSQIYVGAASGGVWRTDNANQALPEFTIWTPLTDHEASLSIGSIAFSPLDPTGNTLFAGTGANSSFSPSDGTPGLNAGVMRTTDGGASWSTFALNPGDDEFRTNSVLPTAIDLDPGPGVSELVLAGTLKGGGLYRSDDTGATWNLISGTGGLPQGDITSLIVDPNNAHRFYAAVAEKGVFRGEFDPATSKIQWTNLNSGFGILVDTAANIQVTAHKAGGTVLFALLSGNTASDPKDILPIDPRGAFRMTNPGSDTATWTTLAVPPSDFTLDRTPGASNTMVADPVDNHVVYIGSYSADVYRYDPSNGGSWVSIMGAGTLNNTKPHGDIRRLAFQGDNTLLETDDGGVYFMPNPRATSDWHSYIGIPGQALGTVEAHDVAWDSQFHVAVEGGQDNGTAVQSKQGSASWVNIHGGDGGDVAVDNASLPGISIRYDSSQKLNGFQRDEFLGSASVPVSTVKLIPAGGLPGFVGSFVTPIELDAIDPALGQSKRIVIGGAANGTDPGAVYEADNAAFASSAADVNWVRIPTGAGFGTVTALAYGGRQSGVDHPRVLYAGSNGQVYLRTPGGTTLEPIGDFGDGEIRDIAIDPADWEHVFVVSAHSVWATQDAGAHWFNRTGNLPDGELRTVVYIGQGSVDSVLVGGSIGVFRMRTNNPGLWARFGKALPNAQVWDLTYNTADHVLVAGTIGRGVWTIPNADTYLTPFGIQQIGSNLGLSGQDDQIRLIRDGANIDLFINNTSNIPTAQYPFDAHQELRIQGLAGNDVLTLDFSQGNTIPDGGISFDGGDDAGDRLVLVGGTASNGSFTNETDTATGSDSGIISLDGSTVEYSGISRINDTVPVDQFILNATQGDDQIDVVDGPVIGGFQTAQLNSASATFVRINLADKTAMNVNGQNGADTFTLSMTSVPDGLTALRLRGEDGNNVNDDGAADVFNIERTLVGVSTTASGGGGDDIFNLAPTSQNLAHLDGDLTLRGGPGSDVLDIHDESNASTQAFTVDASTVSRAGMAGVTYTGFESLVLNAQDVGSTINVQGAHDGTPVTINAGAGDDRINVTPASQNLDDLNADLTIHGGTGSDTLVLDDQSNPNGETFTVTASQVSRPGAANINFSNISALTLHLPDIGATVDLLSANANVTIDGGAGDDTLNIPAALSITPVFRGGAGNDTLNVQAGSYGYTTDFAPATAHLNLIAGGTAALTLGASQHLASLSMSGNARVTLAPGGTRVLQTGGLSVADAGVLDLADNDMILQTADPTARDQMLQYVSGLIKQARAKNAAGKLWQGTGITTSAASPDGTGITGLAVIPNIKYDQNGVPFVLYSALWGQSGLDMNTILVKYTYNGDMNVDGRINFDDYFLINTGFLSNGARNGYQNGDLNFDTIINFDDFFMINTAFLGQGNTVLAAPFARTVAPKKSAPNLFKTLANKPRRKVHAHAAAR